MVSVLSAPSDSCHFRQEKNTVVLTLHLSCLLIYDYSGKPTNIITLYVHSPTTPLLFFPPVLSK